jgi:GNAT superfamily N-acetyltransferase
MAPTYKVIRYRPEFREQVIALQTHLWSDVADMNSDYFRWKYEENPYSDDSLIYLAMCDENVVGMRGMMGAEWQGGASAIVDRCFCACDLVVDPAHRGRGLFRVIMTAAMKDMADRGHPLVLNLSASPYTYLSSIRMGWRLIGSYRPWIWRARERSISRKLRHFMAGRPVLWRFADRQFPVLERNNRTIFQRLAAYFDRAEGLDGSVLGFSAEPPSERMVALRQRFLGDDNRVGHPSDQAYVTWRYRNPLSHYGFVLAGEEALEGYLALRVAKLGFDQDVAIVDWQAANADVLRAMIGAVQRSDAVGSLVIWSATLSANVLATLEALKFNAFDDSRGIQRFAPGLLVGATGTGVSAQKIRLSGHDASELGAWNLRMIASDNY